MKKIFFILTMLLPLVSFADVTSTTDRVRKNQWYLSDTQLQFGNLPNASCRFDSKQTPDAMVCGVPATSGRWIFSKQSQAGSTDFGLAQLGGGAVGISLMSPNGAKNMTLYNDGTNGVISVSSGTVSFPQGISAAISGNASTATALAANPTDCSSNQFANAIAENGNLTCAALADADVPNNITISGGTVDNSIIGGTTPAAATVTNLTATGSVTFSAATNIGWSVRSGANTACNTTCTNACVFGWDAGATTIVDCADATADKCLCAGAN